MKKPPNLELVTPLNSIGQTMHLNMIEQELFAKATFTSELSLSVQLVAGTDADISMVAKTTSGTISQDESHLSPEERERKLTGFINTLMKMRHGSPFEHNMLRLLVRAPIFVYREWHRHRIGFSYNEESGRYKQLIPEFYIPSPERLRRCIKPSGFKPMKPGFAQFSELPPELHEAYLNSLKATYCLSYVHYCQALDMGMDNGLSRITLPVGIMSTQYVTLNLRSAFAFLSLRRDYEAEGWRPKYPSYPLWEMNELARKLEREVQQHFPLSYQAFLANGMVGP